MYDELKKTNLQKCKDALNKEIYASPRKTLSHGSFSTKTLKFAMSHLSAYPTVK